MYSRLFWSLKPALRASAGVLGETAYVSTGGAGVTKNFVVKSSPEGGGMKCEGFLDEMKKLGIGSEEEKAYIDLLSIDIEGAEPSVLRSRKQTAAERRLLEFRPFESTVGISEV